MIYNDLKHFLASMDSNYISFLGDELVSSQEQTQGVFSYKWENSPYDEDFFRILEIQKKWYLDLYGFESESELKAYLESCDVILDAGAGKCGKASWFASLSPNTTVIAADISTSLIAAKEQFKDLENLYFVNIDIGNLPIFSNEFFDYVSCDQVIHHTADPEETFKELTRLTKKNKDFSCYVYRRKAIPRELLDDLFREKSKTMTNEELMALSEQLTRLGQVLSKFDEEIDFEAIPALGIDAGKMTLQRYIYWNFIKCFWNEERGFENSKMVNFDWYSPSQANRYSEEEYRDLIEKNGLDIHYFHEEPACYSGRFRKR